MPEYYPVCLHDDCPLAKTCLHHLAYEAMLKETEVLRLLNPLHCSKNGSCKHFRSNEPLRYAKGFASFRSKMLPGQWSEFMKILRTEWGRTRFYERRRGDILMPPSEQEFVLQALKRSGVSEVFEFDDYENVLTWFD